MMIEVRVIINESQESEIYLRCPEDMINLYLVEQLISDFISDRLIMSGYPKMKGE